MHILVKIPCLESRKNGQAISGVMGVFHYMGVSSIEACGDSGGVLTACSGMEEWRVPNGHLLSGCAARTGTGTYGWRCFIPASS
jgi:hypothetical protein